MEARQGRSRATARDHAHLWQPLLAKDAPSAAFFGGWAMLRLGEDARTEVKVRPAN